MKHIREVKDILQSLEDDRFYQSPDMSKMLCWQQAVRLGISDSFLAELRQDRSINGKFTFETYLNLFVDLLLIEKHGADVFVLSRTMKHDSLDTTIDINALRLAFRDVRFPLPYQIFPGSPDNTEEFIEYNRKHNSPADISDGPIEIELSEIQKTVDELNQGATRPPAEKGHTPQQPTKQTPEALIDVLRAQGVRDAKALAVKAKEQFPGLSYQKIGALLPANPGTHVSASTDISRGKRLLGKKK